MTSDLPTFLIIGAAKSGTTSLYNYLGQHPEIFLTSIKEPNFFAFKDKKDVSFSGPGDKRNEHLAATSLDEYRQLFSDPNAAIRGEASPSSLYYPQAPKQILHHVPDVRLLVILRNPVERAYSNFLTMVKQGREPCRHFATALDQETQRRKAGWSYFWSYIDLGFYHEQLSRYYNLFPKEQIHVSLFRELANQPSAMLRDIFQFLGADPSFQPDLSKQHNPSGIPRSDLLHWLLYQAGIRPFTKALLPRPLTRFLSSHFSEVAQQLKNWKMSLLHQNLKRPPINQSVRRRLQRLYREDILRLQELIDRDLSHWLEEPPPSN